MLLKTQVVSVWQVVGGESKYSAGPASSGLAASQRGRQKAIQNSELPQHAAPSLQHPAPTPPPSIRSRVPSTQPLSGRAMARSGLGKTPCGSAHCQPSGIPKCKTWVPCLGQFVSSKSLVIQVSLGVHAVEGSQAAKPTPAVAFICELSWRERDKTVKPTPG
jgi:hypothetical protein